MSECWRSRTSSQMNSRESPTRTSPSSGDPSRSFGRPRLSLIPPPVKPENPAYAPTVLKRAPVAVELGLVTASVTRSRASGARSLPGGANRKKRFHPRPLRSGSDKSGGRRSRGRASKTRGAARSLRSPGAARNLRSPGEAPNLQSRVAGAGWRRNWRRSPRRPRADAVAGLFGDVGDSSGSSKGPDECGERDPSDVSSRPGDTGFPDMSAGKVRRFECVRLLQEASAHYPADGALVLSHPVYGLGPAEDGSDVRRP